MKGVFKNRLGRILLFLAVGFILLFVFRFIYGYTTDATYAQGEVLSDFFSQLGDVKRNYASARYKSDKSIKPTQEAQGQFDVNQKYERVATLKSKTTRFEEEEKSLRGKIKEENAIIQYEHNVGHKGSRELHLLIGISPQKFDSFYMALLKVGTIGFKEITKVDKTNEFKNLNAKKSSLEITRQSLLDIKKQSGKIDEYINLQNRILEIEQELQNLGVLLGDFDEENEFCTVRFSLFESKQIKPISLLHRLKVSFEWTIQYYLLFICILAASTLFAFFLLLIIDKVLPGIISRINH
jgi:Domain of unknown function (DUF4349)